MEIISRPTSQNVINILNPTRSAISASCAPLLRSVYTAKHGIPLDNINISFPKSKQQIYNKSVDIHGDHFFSYIKYSKKTT